MLEDHPCRLSPAAHSITFRLIQDFSKLRTPHTLLTIGLAIDNFLVIVIQSILLTGYRFWGISCTDILKRKIITNWATSDSRVIPGAWLRLNDGVYGYIIRLNDGVFGYIIRLNDGVFGYIIRPYCVLDLLPSDFARTDRSIYVDVNVFSGIVPDVRWAMAAAVVLSTR